jgi:two-component system, chemotaxis family, protein-glutamate methylesterase/glutaminase
LKAAGPVRLLVVDDSASVRAVLRRFFSWTDDIQVVGEAADGEAAVAAVEALAPDVVLMDLVMPGLDGYRAIERIMERRPTPILVLSSKAARDQVRTAFEALRRGAVEVLPKPEDTESWRHLAEVLPAVVREVAGRHAASPAAAPAPPRRARRRGPAPVEEEATLPRRDLRWLAIGASTGGPSAVADLLAALPAKPPVSVLVVQHISPGFEGGLVDWLAGECGLDVRLARDGESPAPGVVRLGPPGAHLRVGADGRLELDRTTPPWRGHRPAVDELFLSLARTVPSRVAAVLLTGMGTDGVQGMAELARQGALTLAQDEASSVVWGMPRAAIEHGAASKALPPPEIAREVARAWGGRGGEGGTG